MAVLSTMAAVSSRWPSQWPNGRFINQKRPNCQIIEFGARIAIFTISRVKNLSTAGPCAYLRFQEERKRNLVDPASSHMLVSQTKEFMNGLREETKGNLVAILSRPTSRSSRFIKADGRFIKAGQHQWPFYQRRPPYQGRWPSQWPNGRFINQKRPNGQIIGFGARIAVFTISRVKNLSTAGRRKFWVSSRN